MLFIILYQMMMLITPIEVDERQELKKGISLSILTNRDMRKFGALEKRLKLKMTKLVSLQQRISPLKDYILGQKIF